jgi:uncharacterized protein (TIGR00255 family)
MTSKDSSSLRNSTATTNIADGDRFHSPIYSMTGFARVAGRVSDALGFSLSLKSVNHRFLDPQLRMPSGLEALEMRVRRTLKEKLVRGHVEFTLSLERNTERVSQYNGALVAAYIAAFRAAALEHGLEQEPDLNAILRMPGVLTAESSLGSSVKEDAEALEIAVVEQLEPLIAALNVMRAQEGASLATELGRCLDRLSALVDEVAGLRAQVQSAYFERVSERAATLLAGAFERERVLQEVALLVERSDVDEEIARLHTHIEHFHSLLRGGGEIGKKTDFLLQEMNREANTLLSKTSGVAGNATRITELGLGMKAEIEKAREQVQNLE